MRYESLLATLLTLSSFAVTACTGDATGPGATSTANRPDPVSAVAANTPARNTWIPRALEHVERVEAVSATVPNAAGQSILYVIGGWRLGMGAGLNLIEAYNVATNTWSKKHDMPIGLASINGAGVIGGKIYIAGGARHAYGWGMYVAFVYDPAKDTWTQLPDMPVRGETGVVGVIGDKLYVAEMKDLQADRSDFLRYDPATKKWAKLPSPKHAYHVGGVLYGKLYLIGNQTEMYDPATNQWSDKAPPPTGAIWGTAAAAQTKLYVFAGSPTQVYAPLSDSWIVRSGYEGQVGPVAAKVFVDGQPRIEIVGEASNFQYVP
jgi:Kelch motif